MSEFHASACWYADGLQFACARCGNCCSGAPGYVWVSPPEVRAIAEWLGMRPDQFYQQHTRRVGQRQSLLELADGDCQYLVREPGGTTLCAIHPVRPLQCRTWPFWKANLSPPHAWASAARHCPGINHGQGHPLLLIQDALRRNDDAGLPL